MAYGSLKQTSESRHSPAPTGESCLFLQRYKNKNKRLTTISFILQKPLDEQFVPVFENGNAIVLRHLIRSTEAIDYNIVRDVATAIALDRKGPIWILPEINIHERGLRESIGLSTNVGYTPDIMIESGSFIDVKSPLSTDTISANACKAFRQGGVACITDYSTGLDERHINQYAKWVLKSQGYLFNEVFFYIKGKLYKRTKE